VVRTSGKISVGLLRYIEHGRKGHSVQPRADARTTPGAASAGPQRSAERRAGVGSTSIARSFLSVMMAAAAARPREGRGLYT
jgi:hypothetical protein